jgi:hypothetical protein
MGEEFASERFCPQAARIGEKFDANSPRRAVLLCEELLSQ